jgi:peptide/nickel transport system substrate-binding protein
LALSLLMPGFPTVSTLPRRELLKTIVAVGATAAVDLSAWPALADATPRRGGRIKVAGMSVSTADTLDPARGALSTDYVRHYMVYSGLTQFDHDLRPRMALAEEITSDDQLNWTVRLRRGVVFHDGASLTPRDVVYSLERHRNPATASKVSPVAEQFDEIRAVGPDHVHIRLKSPNADLPSILAVSHFLILREGTKDFRTAIGTGPYRIVEFTPGVRTLVERNDSYWKPGQPYLDQIELIGIGDEPSRVNALLSGDVQLAIAVDPRSVRRIKASAGREVLETRSGLYTDLVMRQDAIPTGNPDFVLAVKLLFDRELIRQALFRGYAMIGNDQPIPPGHPYYFAGLPQRSYDPDQARFLLGRAGLSDTRIPVYASPAATGSVDMAVLLQQSAARAGLRLEVKRVPADGYWSYHWMRRELFFGNVNPRPTADLLFTLFFKSDAPWNESGWKNAQFDQLLMAARGEGDEAKRRQMYHDMQVLVHEQCGIGIPAFISILDGYDTRLRGFGSIPIGGLMGYSFAEYVWLDN